MYTSQDVRADGFCVCGPPRCMHSSLWAGRQVQIHGFASQGFTCSDHNNYLTMKTSKGTFALSDGGVNLSTPISDKFRVGAQIYIRNIFSSGN